MNNHNDYLAKTKEILNAVSKAFKNFKNAFSYQKNSDELFAIFESTLTVLLGKHDIICDYIWGDESANIDGFTKNYYAKRGDVCIFDVSVGKDGTWCDVTRTFFVGEINKERENCFNAIKKSLREGQKALKISGFAKDVFVAVDNALKGYGKKLVHHAGHAIGEKNLLEPRFLPDNNTPLILGARYAIESGLYDKFGIRLENDYLLTEKGAVDLFENLMPLNIKEYILR